MPCSPNCYLLSIREHLPRNQAHTNPGQSQQITSFPEWGEVHVIYSGRSHQSHFCYKITHRRNLMRTQQQIPSKLKTVTHWALVPIMAGESVHLILQCFLKTFHWEVSGHSDVSLCAWLVVSLMLLSVSSLFSILTTVCRGNFIFWSCLFGVVCVSCISVITCQQLIWIIPLIWGSFILWSCWIYALLTWDSSPSCMPNFRFGLSMVHHSSCTFIYVFNVSIFSARVV